MAKSKYGLFPVYLPLRVRIGRLKLSEYLKRIINKPPMFIEQLKIQNIVLQEDRKLNNFFIRLPPMTDEENDKMKLSPKWLDDRFFSFDPNGIIYIKELPKEDFIDMNKNTYTITFVLEDDKGGYLEQDLTIQFLNSRNST